MTDSNIQAFQHFVSSLIEYKIPSLAGVFSEYESLDGDILSYLQNVFKRYKEEIELLEGLDEIGRMVRNQQEQGRVARGLKPIDIPEFNLLDEISQVCLMIEESLNCYFAGYPSEAYNSIEKVMNSKKRHLFQLLPRIETEYQTFYRVRSGHIDDAGGMYHVPYHLRNLSDSYRYSIPGVPALYCGTSLLTCLKETGVGIGEEFTAVKYSIFPPKERERQIVSFIDLTLPDTKIRLWESYCFAVFYPLIVACGLRVRDRSAKFKQEYVVPQLLFQYLRGCFNYIDGIIYLSTRFDNLDYKNYRRKNFVIWLPHSSQEKGYNMAMAERIKASENMFMTYTSDSDVTDYQKILSYSALSPLDKNI